MGNIRYDASGGFERDIQKMLLGKVQEAVDEVFAAHANTPEETVRPALAKALEERGVPPQQAILDQAVPAICRGEKPTVV